MSLGVVVVYSGFLEVCLLKTAACGGHKQSYELLAASDNEIELKQLWTKALETLSQ